MKVFIIRNYGEKQTLGNLIVYDGFNKIFECKTLELPWKDNQRNISCIPEDTYWVRKRKAEESPSKSYDHFIVENVPNRSYILWHGGTYYTHIKGCFLMGQYFSDVNNDRVLDIMKTRFTIDLLYKILPERFELTITS